MKSIVSFFLVTLIIFSAAQYSASAQRMSKLPAKNVVHQDPNPAPADPLSVGIDAPIPVPPVPPRPPFAFSMPELKFGAQGTEIESCIKVTITNMSNSAETITGLFSDDSKNYSIPNPEQKMLPMSIQPKKTFDISVCFKPLKVGEYKSRLVIKTPTDSAILPIRGKGMKPEDISKLPKDEVTIIKPKKKGKEWTFKLQLVSSSRVSMQLFDDLGVLTANFLSNDLKEDGVYEIPFDGLDKDKKKLPEGNYYLRCIIQDVTRTGTGDSIKLTKTVELKD